MSQKIKLHEALKIILKSRGFRYSDVAAVLDMHEGSVKALFSKSELSLDRMEKILNMVDMDFSDLVQIMQQHQAQTNSLSFEQESLLVSDTKLLLIAHLLLNGWSPRDILDSYYIDHLEMIQYLATLDKIKLIELLPGDRVRLLTTRTFSWIKSGPIESFYEEHVSNEFMSSQFEGPGEIKLFISGMLSRQSNEELQRSIKRLSTAFNDSHTNDLDKGLDEKFGTSLMIAMRPWDIKIFSQHRREGTDKKF